MLTDTEFQVLLDDASKVIRGDIEWRESEDHSPWVEFRAEVKSDVGWPLFVVGSFNPIIPALSLALVLKTEGRIYALDMGKDHHNPQCNQVGETHKHRWSEVYRDKEAYLPGDIKKPVDDVPGVWLEFCAEANLKHLGHIQTPPAMPSDLFT
jgi:hypothetical protein